MADRSDSEEKKLAEEPETAEEEREEEAEMVNDVLESTLQSLSKAR